MKAGKLKLLMCLAAGLLVFQSACRQGSRKNQKPLIVATTTFAGEVARVLCGPDCEVAQIMGPGIDPHLYKATLRDARLLYDADVVFVNGLHLEGKMAEILEDLKGHKQVISLAEGLHHRNLIRVQGTELSDPHFWFDAGLFAQAAKSSASSLVQAGVIKREDAKTRLLPYLEELHNAQAYSARAFASIPEGKRVLATTHDAFSYMGRAYGMEIKTLQGISTLSEFSVRDVSRLSAFLSQRQVSAMFPETSTPRRSVQAVVQACARQNHTLKIGPALYTDALGPKGTPQETYIGMYRSNVDTIVKYLK